MPRHPAAPPVDLAGRVVVVTGTGPGSLGAATADALTQWGATVVTTTRTGGSHPLDLTSRPSVASFASWFAGSFDRLDVLVNNAGVHLDLVSAWKEPHLVDGHEVHWRTNYLGTMDLTLALLPLVAEGGRVVNVVSRLHRRGRNADLLTAPSSYSSWDAYGRSKLALVHASRELHRRHGVHAVSVHPGSVLTGIATKGLEGRRVLSAARRVLRPLEARMLLTPEQGAQNLLWCATSPEVRAGTYVERCREVPPSPEAEDAAVAAQLWDRTLAWNLAQS